MTKRLHISDDLWFPVDIVTQTVGVLAKRRAGKSYLLRRLVEQLFKANQQAVVVDPKGDWWGIRSTADGRSPGLPVVILGGDRGDVKLEPHAGEVVAKLVVEERVSALLDLSLLRKHEVATFMTGFLENLYRMKAREQYRTPMMLAIDEADAVAPQRPMKGEERMLGAAEDIVRRGGQRGIGCAMATQRAAVLNKNVLTQVQVLIALRTIAPQDLAALDAWIDVHGTAEQRRQLMASLPSLPVGDAWIWSPGWPTVDGIFERVHVLPIQTFDSGSTPKPGEKRVEPRSVADVDLDALRRQMTETIERSKAEDPTELRKRIAELEREVRARPSPAAAAAPSPRDLDRLRAEIKRELRAEWEPLLKERDAANRELQGRFTRLDRMFRKALVELEPIAKEFGAEVPKLTAPPAMDVVSAAPAPIRREMPVMTRTGPARPRAGTGGNGKDAVSNVEQKILDALAELETLGARAPARELVALLAGYTHLQSKGFVNAMSALRTSGKVDYPDSGHVVLTEAGRESAHYPERPRSPQEVQERICELLGGASAKILRPLIAAYPHALPREDVAREAGYGHLQSKGFVNSISRLRTLGFVDYPDRGSIVAQPVLFLEDRR